MWTATLSLIDGKGKRGSFSLNFDPTRTIAQIENWITAITVPLNNIIKGGVVAISISRAMAVPVLMQQVPTDDSDVEEKMKVIFKDINGFFGSFAIPTLDETLVNVGSSTIDQADANVILFNTAIETGINFSGSFTAPTTNRGDAVALITSEDEVFTSSRTGR